MAMAAPLAMTMARLVCPSMADPAPQILAPLTPAPQTLAADRLHLAQLLSPAFPIGSFAHSQGLETAIAEGLVPDPAALQDWITTLLAQGSPRLDAVFVSLTRQNSLPLADLTGLFHAMTSSAERAQESAELGRGFGTLLAALGHPQPPLPYPIALGLATRRLVLPMAEVLALFLQTTVTQLLSVAVRFMPMGQARGQILLAALTPLITRTAASLSTAGLDDLHAFTPGADMAAMRHETQDVRIFRT